MHILFISHRVPYPPDKGDKLRAFNILKYLSQSHTISLACVMDDRNDEQYLEDLAIYCNRIWAVPINSLFSLIRMFWNWLIGRPLTIGHYYSWLFRNGIYKILREEQIDLIYVYSTAMAQYVLKVDSIPKILDLVDADSEKWASWSKYARFPMSCIYHLEGKRIKAYEKAVCPQFQTCILVADSEKKLLDQHVSGHSSCTVTNGINLHFYNSYLSDPLAQDRRNLIFVGGMFYFAYIDGMLYFYRNIFDRIAQAYPDSKLYIVGANPARSIRNLAGDSRVFVTGYVKAVRPYLQMASVYIVPLRIAPGVQNKILEALAMQVPVVTTTAALQGIDAEPGRDLLVADTPEEFAGAVNRLLADPDLRQELARNGRNLVQQRYDWNENLKNLDPILDKVRPISRG